MLSKTTSSKEATVVSLYTLSVQAVAGKALVVTGRYKAVLHMQIIYRGLLKGKSVKISDDEKYIS